MGQDFTSMTAGTNSATTTFARRGERSSVVRRVKPMPRPPTSTSRFLQRPRLPPRELGQCLLRAVHALDMRVLSSARMMIVVRRRNSSLGRCRGIRCSAQQFERLTHGMLQHGKGKMDVGWSVPPGCGEGRVTWGEGFEAQVKEFGVHYDHSVAGRMPVLPVTRHDSLLHQPVRDWRWR